MNQPVVSTVDYAAMDWRLEYLKKYGVGSLAYSSLQGGMRYFLEPGLGYIAFVPLDYQNRTSLCLSDPICKTDDVEHLLDTFIESYEYPIFLYVSKPVASLLSKKGFLVNEIGVEIVIDLAEFSLSGGEKSYLRCQKNRALKDGVNVRELLCTDVGPDSLRSLSEEWRRKKIVSSRELSFLSRPIVYADEADVRKFFAYRNDNLIGFGGFDPIYRDKAVIGYLANTLRAVGNANYSIQDLIILKAMDTFKQEGKEILSLGFLPLFDVSDNGEFRYSRVFKALFQNVYEHGSWIYEFKDLAFHKTRYRPGTGGCSEFKVYCAFKEPVRYLMFIKVFQTMGINFVEQLRKQFLSLVKPGSQCPI